MRLKKKSYVAGNLGGWVHVLYVITRGSDTGIKQVDDREKKKKLKIFHLK